jgi:hypothetical protein
MSSTSGRVKASETNTGIGQGLESAYQQDANNLSGVTMPFLENELNNPQGLGQPALNQIQTQSGQAIAGATGAGNEQALLNASRTGNTAAVPGIIDANTRNAIAGQSNNALSTNIENAKLKQQQQQAGASGLEKMYGTDVSAALQSLGLSNQSIGEWNNGASLSNNFWDQYALNGEKAAAGAAAAGGG